MEQEKIKTPGAVNFDMFSVEIEGMKKGLKFIKSRLGFYEKNEDYAQLKEILEKLELFFNNKEKTYLLFSQEQNVGNFVGTINNLKFTAESAEKFGNGFESDNANNKAKEVMDGLKNLTDLITKFDKDITRAHSL